MKTKNLDIADIKRYSDAFRVEIENMASIYRFNVGGFDVERIEQYVSVLQEKLDNVKPPVDRPKWHPHEMEIGAISDNYEFDNAALSAFLRKFDATLFELAYSQSGDMSGGLQKFDHDRYQAGLDELKNEIEVIKNISPIDAPESANVQE